MATPNYNINYDDKRFTEVEADKKAALTEVEKTYGGMVNDSDKFYQSQIDAAKNWANTQIKNQNEQTDFAIEKIEQQKDQANKDYIKEQSGAYTDWQKQSNQYGANAEQMAAQGMTNTGYSESSQVSMYNTYQNRVATAREAYSRAVLNYDNLIQDARLQNNSKLAEIAYEALHTQLELSLQGFQYKNQLIIEKSNKKLEVDNMYYNRYQDVLDQINTENTLKEKVRQYEQDYAMKVKEYEEGIRQFNEELERLKARDEAEDTREAQRIALQRAQLQEEKRQFEILHGGGGSGGGSGGDGSSGGDSGDSGGNGKIDKDNKPEENTGVKKDSNTTHYGLPKVNMQSILSLGYGFISEARLNDLIAQGFVKEYEKNGELHYKRAYVYGH